MSERLRTGLVLLITLAHGLIYLLVVPPWQHYDEPTHFERIWLAARGHLAPGSQDVSQTLRRQIVSSMHDHNFYALLKLGPPNILHDETAIVIGFSQLSDPPAYYVAASLPLRLAPHLDVVTQLYLARLVSLLFFVLTIAMLMAMLRQLTPPGHPLRWAVPLAIALHAPFADLMTAANNDVGAVFTLSLFLWGAVRTIVAGITWRRLGWLLGSALLCMTVKITAAVALPLTPLVLVLALWRQRGWRWRWLAAGALVVSLLGLLAMLERNEPAYWYYQGPPSGSAHRVRRPEAPVGEHALRVQSLPARSSRMLLVLEQATVRQLAGRDVTVGAWIWASTPAQIGPPILRVFNQQSPRRDFGRGPLITLASKPAFVAWSARLPEQPIRIDVILEIPAARPETFEQSDGPAEIFIDGVIVAEGSFPASTAPVFDTPEARAGVWDGVRFANSMRNPSAEQTWFHAPMAIDQLVGAYTYTTPSMLLQSLQDTDRTGETVFWQIPKRLLSAFFGSFGWGGPRLEPGLNPIFYALALLGLLGLLVWTARRKALAPGVGAALFVLGLAGMLVWSLTVLRVLPMLALRLYTPTPRYTFPVIVSTFLFLVGGWWSLWPRRYALYGLLLLVAAMVALDGLALATIVDYYHPESAGIG